MEQPGELEILAEDHQTYTTFNIQTTHFHGMFIRHTVPPPVLPSKVKKFAMGGSRAARAFRIS